MTKNDITEDDIKVGQKWRCRGDKDVIIVEWIGESKLLRYCDLIKDVEDLVWTSKGDGYVPEIKYESDASIVYVDRQGKEEPATMQQFRYFYEKRPRKIPESIEELKKRAMFI